MAAYAWHPYRRVVGSFRVNLVVSLRSTAHELRSTPEAGEGFFAAAAWFGPPMARRSFALPI